MDINLASRFNTSDNTYHFPPTTATTVADAAQRAIGYSIWIGILFTVLCALLLLSTKAQRTGAVFPIQCVGFSLALIYNGIEIAACLLHVRDVFALPTEKSHLWFRLRVHTCALILEHIVPLLCDSALIFKVASFYPSALYSARSRVCILLPVVFIFFARVVITAVTSWLYYVTEDEVIPVKGDLKATPYAESMYATSLHVNIVAYALTSAFSAYATLVLLWQSYKLGWGSSKGLRQRHLRRRVRFAIEAILMTFLPPLCLSVGAAITLSCPVEKDCHFRDFSSALCNVSVIFGLLATTWSSIRSRQAADQFSETNEESTRPEDLHGITLPGTLISSIIDEGGSHSHNRNNSPPMYNSNSSASTAYLPAAQLQSSEARQRVEHGHQPSPSLSSTHKPELQGEITQNISPSIAWPKEFAP